MGDQINVWSNLIPMQLLFWLSCKRLSKKSCSHTGLYEFKDCFNSNTNIYTVLIQTPLNVYIVSPLPGNDETKIRLSQQQVDFVETFSKQMLTM